MSNVTSEAGILAVALRKSAAKDNKDQIVNNHFIFATRLFAFFFYLEFN